MDVRKINPENLRDQHFAHQHVLTREDERITLIGKLLRAVILTNCEQDTVGIVIVLESGEVIETYCDLIDWADDFIMIKGGASIPVRAIVDVEF
jgi:hypothetical protein